MNEDDRIKQALEHLRDAKPSREFERRLLTSLRNEITFQGRERRFLPAWPSAAVAFLALVAISVCLDTPWFVARMRRAHQNAVRFHTETIGSLPAPPVGVPQPPSTRPAWSHKSLTHKTVRRAPTEHGTAAIETPAPAMPLTEQEKLLLRIVHRRDPGNVNLLNPDARNSQSAQATQQFQRFFDMTPVEVRRQFE